MYAERSRPPAPGRTLPMPELMTDRGASPLRCAEPARARALAAALAQLCGEIGRDSVSVMHVCGSHEQSIAKFGLRTLLPKPLNVIMGPGCPVCVTDVPEVDEAVALALDGRIIATYGDMVRVPGTSRSLGDAQAEGARIEGLHSAEAGVGLARGTT